MQITELEPKPVFSYFAEICRIPHGSGSTGRLADYCLAVAREHGLEAHRDDAGNVTVFKPGTSGYENSAPVILQGHLDMVCEKRPDCPKDLTREGPDVFLDGGFLRARGTTLGGDDGIAVAYLLALLTARDVPHPPLEALFTADEEMGLSGAAALDASRLTGRRLINLDSEEEGVLTAGCAGAARVSCTIPIAMQSAPGQSGRRLAVGGLVGGHSGIDIHRDRKNAAKVLGGLLDALNRRVPLTLASLEAGGRLNAIPSHAEAVVCIPPEAAAEFDRCTAEFDASFRQNRAANEPEAAVRAEPVPAPARSAGSDGTRRAIFALLQAPSGVRSVHPDLPGLVQTSSNLGHVSLEDGALKLGFMVRSNVNAEKAELIGSIRSLAEYLDGAAEVGDDYPAWEYRPDSPLRDTMAAVYESMYGAAPAVRTIHAGLECGILSEKLHGGDFVSIGPNMHDVHTPSERLDTASAARVWAYLLEVLRRLR